MGSITDWRKVVFFICISGLIFSCSTMKDSVDAKYKEQKYYFIVQVQDVMDDTLSYCTINIYTSLKAMDLEVYDNAGNTIPPSDKYRNLTMRNYFKGELRNINKSYINKIIILSTDIEDVENNFIKFDRIEDTEMIDLTKLYHFPYSYE